LAESGCANPLDLAYLRISPCPPSLPGNAGALLLRLPPEANCVVGADVEKLKQRLSLLDYLRQQHWTARPIAHGPEFVGLCPLIRKPALGSMSTPAKISSTITVAVRAAISFASSSCPVIYPSAKVSLTSSSRVLLQLTLSPCWSKPDHRNVSGSGNHPREGRLRLPRLSDGP
jgi:hypothetical protein